MEVYINLPTLNEIKSIFDHTDMNGLTSISDQYWFIRKQTCSFYIANITDVLKSDIINIELLNDMIKKYGQNKIDLFIHNKDDIITNKLKSLISNSIEICEDDNLNLIIYSTNENQRMLQLFIHIINNNFETLSMTMNNHNQCRRLCINIKIK